jgi:hypothetical protein
MHVVLQQWGRGLHDTEWTEYAVQTGEPVQGEEFESVAKQVCMSAARHPFLWFGASAWISHFCNDALSAVSGAKYPLLSGFEILP